MRGEWAEVVPRRLGNGRRYRHGLPAHRRVRASYFPPGGVPRTSPISPLGTVQMRSERQLSLEETGMVFAEFLPDARVSCRKRSFSDVSYLAHTFVGNTHRSM